MFNKLKDEACLQNAALTMNIIRDNTILLDTFHPKFDKLLDLDCRRSLFWLNPFCSLQLLEGQ